MAFIIIGIVGFNIYKASNYNGSYQESNSKYYSSVDELSNNDYSSMDTNASIYIDQVGNGVSDTNHSYMSDGNPKREKVYVAANEKSNKIVSIYKVKYKDFFHQENSYIVYVPLVYENIKNSKSVTNFRNPQVEAPEYYFDSEKKSYTYGYKTLEDAYNDLIKPLKDDYKISEK